MVIVGLTGAVVLLWFGRPHLLAGRGRLPRRFEVADIDELRVPLDARQPLAYLNERLSALGFERADLPVRVPSVQGLGRQLLLVPYVHPSEHALFVMGIESRPVGPSQIMLHILTPLQGDSRVETSTLPGLDQVAPPPGVDARVVLDADTVEEIWSRHRLALNEHQRADRAPVPSGRWREFAAAAYEAWVQSGVRAHRLVLDGTGERYRIRPRSRTVR